MNAADVLDLVEDVAYITFAAAAGSAPTVVARLVVRGGSALVGASTPRTGVVFDREIGQRQALDAALRQLVELERFHQRRLAGGAA